MDLGFHNIVGVGDSILLYTEDKMRVVGKVTRAGTNNCEATYTELVGVKAKTVTVNVRYDEQDWPLTWSHVVARAEPVPIARNPPLVPVYSVNENFGRPVAYVPGRSTGTVSLKNVTTHPIMIDGIMLFPNRETSVSTDIASQAEHAITTGTLILTTVPAAPKPAVAIADLVRCAQAIAREVAKKQGTVTSTDVFAELHARGVPLDGHDPRWMGQVFSARKGWKRVRYAKLGSHRRPISVWKLR